MSRFCVGFVLLCCVIAFADNALGKRILWLNTSIEHSLGRTISKKTAKHGPALAAQVERLLGWHGNVARDLRAGDRLIIGYWVDDSQPLLHAAFYRGTKLKLDALRFNGGDGAFRFYDRRGKLVEQQLDPNPVPSYVQVTERVQSGGGRRQHRGIDLKADVGAPILSPIKGKVTRVNWNTRYNGLCIEVRDHRGNTHRFLHLHRVAKLKPGQRIRIGDSLGQVGNTGRSSAAHLHYEITDSKGRVLNPLKVVGARRPSISSPLMATFKYQLNKILDRFKLRAS